MNGIKRITAVILAMMLLGVNAVSASRMRDAKQNSMVSEGSAVSDNEMTVEDYANREYFSPSPAEKKKTIYSGYTYNGVEIDVPDFSGLTDYSPDEINTLSDAVCDYLGWDILLGTSDRTEGGGFYFKPIPSLSSTPNTTFGYGRKKFGEGSLKLRIRVSNETGAIDGRWLGISFLCSTTQSLQWTGNPGYLFVIKEDQIELQKWFNSQIMLGTWETKRLRHNEWQEFEVRTKKLEEGYDISLYIDGEEAVHAVDRDAPYAPEEGYFNLYSGFSELYVEPVGSEVTLTQEGIKKPDDTEQETVITDGVLLSYNGSQREIPKVYQTDKTLMIPLRAVSDALGGRISWNGELRTATVSTSQAVLKITDTFDEYNLNEINYRTPERAVIRNDLLYVPKECIENTFKVIISADEDNGIIIKNK